MGPQSKDRRMCAFLFPLLQNVVLMQLQQPLAPSPESCVGASWVSGIYIYTKETEMWLAFGRFNKALCHGYDTVCVNSSELTDRYIPELVTNAHYANV